MDNAPNYLAGCVIQKEINVNKPGGGGKGGGWPFDILEVACGTPVLEKQQHVVDGSAIHAHGTLYKLGVIFLDEPSEFLPETVRIELYSDTVFFKKCADHR